MRVSLLQFAFLAVLVAIPCSAQESPFFVTYTHHMEEPGNLEIETSSTMGIPRSGQKFYAAPYMEVEYGLTAQWTTELYLETSSVWGDSTVFTGWRFENRYKPLKREHWINPVLYLEFENVNEASRIQKEIEGGGPDLISSNRELRGEHAHELETKLILSTAAALLAASAALLTACGGGAPESGKAPASTTATPSSAQSPAPRWPPVRPRRCRRT